MKAYELLAKPESWTQHVFARDPQGESVHWEDTAARCWCLIGAVKKVHGVGWRRPVEIMQHHLTSTPLDDWNDNPARTHAEVVELLRRFDI